MNAGLRLPEFMFGANKLTIREVLDDSREVLDDSREVLDDSGAISAGSL